MFSHNNRTTPVTKAPPPTTPPLVTSAFESNREFSIFEISFLYYKVLGILVTILWAIPMSYIFKSDQKESQDPKLFTPFVRKFLPPSQVTELEELPLKAELIKYNPELHIDISKFKIDSK